MDRVLRPCGVIALAMQAFAPTIIDHPREEELSNIISKVNNNYYFLVLLSVFMKLLIYIWLALFMVATISVSYEQLMSSRKFGRLLLILPRKLMIIKMKIWRYDVLVISEWQKLTF